MTLWKTEWPWIHPWMHDVNDGCLATRDRTTGMISEFQQGLELRTSVTMTYKNSSWVGTLHWLIDLFSLYVLFSHLRPRDGTKGNSFFQMSSYARANVRITKEKNKRKIPMRAFTWSEMGKQNVQAKKVCSSHSAPLAFNVISSFTYRVEW